jgi:hypothetical protein
MSLFLQLSFLLILGGLFFFILGVKKKKTWLKQVGFNIEAIFLALFLYEEVIVNLITEESRVGNNLTVKWLEGNDNYIFEGADYFLGYGTTRENAKANAIKTHGDDTLYDVTYTIKNNFRDSPNSNDTSQSNVVFLVRSQTLGDGLEEHETLPVWFNHYMDNKYRVQNFGFQGYGPHQAMAAVDRVILQKERYLKYPEKTKVIFNFFEFHVPRSAGNTPWDDYGPWYEVVNATLAYKGTFAELHPRGFAFKLYSKFWLSSNIYKNHFKILEPNTPEEIDIALYLIKEMHNNLQKAGIDFFVMIDKETKENKQSKQFLINNNIPHECIECLIPDFEENEAYEIPHDGHPSSLQNKVKGKKLVEVLSKKKLL